MKDVMRDAEAMTFEQGVGRANGEKYLQEPSEAMVRARQPAERAPRPWEGNSR
jgi:hypothetical protein